MFVAGLNKHDYLILTSSCGTLLSDIEQAGLCKDFVKQDIVRVDVVVVEPRLYMEVGGCNDYEVDGTPDGLQAILDVVFGSLERLCLREPLSIDLLCNEPLGLGVIITVRVTPGVSQVYMIVSMCSHTASVTVAPLAIVPVLKLVFAGHLHYKWCHLRLADQTCSK